MPWEVEFTRFIEFFVINNYAKRKRNETKSLKNETKTKNKSNIKEKILLNGKFNILI